MRGETCTGTHAVYGWFDRTYGLMSMEGRPRRRFFFAGGLRSMGGTTSAMCLTGLSSSTSIHAGTWHTGH